MSLDELFLELQGEYFSSRNQLKRKLMSSAGLHLQQSTRNHLSKNSLEKRVAIESEKGLPVATRTNGDDIWCSSSSSEESEVEDEQGYLVVKAAELERKRKSLNTKSSCLSTLARNRVVTFLRKRREQKMRDGLQDLKALFETTVPVTKSPDPLIFPKFVSLPVSRGNCKRLELPRWWFSEVDSGADSV